jgi:acetyl-CoA carboxylase carboxyl transferase subunit beta
LRQLLDPASIEWLDFPIVDADPLQFVDAAPYPERIAAARSKTRLDESVVCARGRIGGSPVVVAAMDFGFMGGSLGSVAGELVTCAAEVAMDERTPLLLITASGGARMQEGALSLMQMAKTAAALRQLDEAGILTISLITDPTYGGVAASFATLTDIIIAEPRARLGFAGPRVVEQVLHQKPPTGFQGAERLLSLGLIDAIRPRTELRDTIGHLLRAVRDLQALPRQRTSEREVVRHLGPTVILDPDELEERDPWEIVQAARDMKRPTTSDYIDMLMTDFEELHGDRASGECRAIVGGIGHLAGRPVVIVGHQKAHEFGELTANNFGMASPAGYRKSARLARLANKLGLPLITLVDTPGAHPGVDAEDHGQAVAIAENLALFSQLRVPVVSVIIGEGGSGGALALAVANRVLMSERAIYSVISPEGCASILWSGSVEARRAAAALRLDAPSLLRLGVVDGVIPEPAGGAGIDHRGAAAFLEAALLSALDELKVLGRDELAIDRQARFRRFGQSMTSAGAGIGVVRCTA